MSSWCPSMRSTYQKHGEPIDDSEKDAIPRPSTLAMSSHTRWHVLLASLSCSRATILRTPTFAGRSDGARILDPRSACLLETPSDWNAPNEASRFPSCTLATYVNRLTNSSAFSATSRQPASIVNECPRPDILTISVTPLLRFCFLYDAFEIAKGTV